MTQPVMVLVDADNISATHARKILEVAASLGQVHVRRCYLNSQGTSAWLSQPDFRVIYAGCGKNGADILIAMDAMEFALGGQSLVFILASSDSDFSHLAHRLRERGHWVHGVGEAKTPPAFRAACSTFIQIGPAQEAKSAPKAVTQPAPPSPKAPASPPKPSAPPKPPLTADELEKTIRSLIGQHSKNGKGMLLSELAPKMHNLHGIRISTYPEKTWRAYFLARAQKFDIDPRGAGAHVRYRTAGFPPTAPKPS